MIKQLVCMLVDDDTEDHEIFLMALKNIQPRVTCIVEREASKALDILRTTKINPDYIFVDMKMPRMSGKEFIVEIRKMKHLENVQLVVYSSSYLEKEKFLSLGASQFISKPINIPLLEKALTDCFGFPKFIADNITNEAMLL